MTTRAAERDNSLTRFVLWALSRRMTRRCACVTADLLRFAACLFAIFAFARRMTVLLASMVTASQERAALLSAGDFLRGTPDVLDGRILAAQTRFGREERARRARGRFVALMRGSRVAARWCGT